MNAKGLAAVYGNHLGAQLLGLAQAASDRNRPPSPSTTHQRVRWQNAPSATNEDEEDADEFEDEIIEEMSGNWTSSSSSSSPPPAATSASSSSSSSGQAVPRIDSVEWSKMEEGPDDENLPVDNAGSNNDAEDGSPQRAVLKSLKRKRKAAAAEAANDMGEQPSGKKRLSCIDCGCRAALKACTKVMCIDCCAKEGRVCDAHAKKLYEKEVRKLEPLAFGGAESGGAGSITSGGGGGGKDKSAKKKVRVRASAGGEGGDGRQHQQHQQLGDQDDPEDEEDSDGTIAADRDTERDAAAAGDEDVNSGGGSGKAKRSVLYETIAKQDKKIRALQNDLKELRTLLLSVVDKQNTFSRQLRHISGTHSDSLVIDEDDEDDEEAL